jgi:carbamoylphosphate synthase small subunit
MSGYQETLTDPSYYRQVVGRHGTAHRQHGLE